MHMVSIFKNCAYEVDVFLGLLCDSIGLLARIGRSDCLGHMTFKIELGQQRRDTFCCASGIELRSRLNNITRGVMWHNGEQ
jgi:hypothetical protein